MSVVRLKCPTCRQDWPLRKCEWCGVLFDPSVAYDGTERARTAPGRRRRYCSTDHRSRAEYRRAVLRGMGKVA